MGIDSDRCISEVQSEFICPICQDIVVDPVECQQCQTNYCRTCIDQWAQRSDQCTNRCEFKPQQPHRFYRTMLNQLQFRCMRQPQGCEAILTLEVLSKHEFSECQFREEKCPFDGCMELLKLFEIEQHKLECLFKSLPCAKCGLQVLETQRQSHSCLLQFQELISIIQANNQELEDNLALISEKLRCKNAQDLRVHQIQCSNCQSKTIQGVLYMCMECIDYQICWDCKTSENLNHMHNNYFQLANSGVHHDVVCDGCNQRIFGIRHKCTVCSDFDFCHKCFVNSNHGHQFDHWAPYLVEVVPLIPQVHACVPNSKFQIKLIITNYGLENIKRMMMLCINDQSVFRSNRIRLRGFEVQPGESLLITVNKKVIQQRKGRYASRWKLCTDKRISYFGPDIVIEVHII